MGEGPFWNDRNQSLYFINMWEREIHRYTPSTKEHKVAKVVGNEPSVTFVIPVDDALYENNFVIGFGNKLALVKWDGESDRTEEAKIIRTITESDERRLNDAKVSPSGILFIGSMGLQLPDGSYEKGVGKLHKYRRGETTAVITEMNIPNGLAWSSDEKSFYIADSDSFNIVKYDYDRKNSSIDKPKELINWKKNDFVGFPDGFTIDEEDHLWVATFSGRSVMRINGTTGKVLQEICVPAHQVTSVTFGGPDLDVLYVTTASFKLNDEQKSKKELVSGLYKIENLGVKGTRSVPFTFRH